MLYGLEDRPGWGTAVFVGMQHFLAMFASIITPALVLCKGVGAAPETVALALGASLLTSGAATLVQIHRIGPVGSGMLSVQGTSSAFIAVMAGMGAAMTKSQSATQMPSPGAVCPAMVTLPLRSLSCDFRCMVPLMSKTMVRVPLCSQAQRREPVPESLRLVT